MQKLTELVCSLLFLVVLFVGWQLVLWIISYDIGQLILTGLWVGFIWTMCIVGFRRTRERNEPVWPVVVATIIMGYGQGAMFLFMCVDFVNHHFLKS